jgi:hypothetical protein
VQEQLPAVDVDVDVAAAVLQAAVGIPRNVARPRLHTQDNAQAGVAGNTDKKAVVRSFQSAMGRSHGVGVGTYGKGVADEVEAETRVRTSSQSGPGRHLNNYWEGTCVDAGVEARDTQVFGSSQANCKADSGDVAPSVGLDRNSPRQAVERWWEKPIG